MTAAIIRWGKGNNSFPSKTTSRLKKSFAHFYVPLFHLDGPAIRLEQPYSIRFHGQVAPSELYHSLCLGTAFQSEVKVGTATKQVLIDYLG